MPAYAYDDGDDDDRNDPWSSSYESPFDKPKDRGPFHEKPERREDRVRTYERDTSRDRDDRVQAERYRTPSGGEVISNSLRDYY